MVFAAPVACRRGDGRTDGQAGTKSVQPVATGPNVVLFVMDTTRPDFFSCYGYDMRTTPHIDEMAAEGTLFEKAFATYNWTVPSHATLLSGLYPSEAGASSGNMRLADEVKTLAERLLAAGYTTGAVVCNPWLAHQHGFAQGFEDYTEMWRKEFHDGDHADGGIPAAGRVVQWIEEHAAVEKPFFLFVNINVPHLPYTPRPEAQRRFSRRFWPRARVDELREFKDEIAQNTGAITLGEQDFQILRDLYAAEIFETDQIVGAVLDALRVAGILDETLFVLTSDHGENIGEHGRTGHMFSMHDTTMHVPLIVRYPKLFRAGAVNRDLISLIHVVPGILEACNVAMTDDDRLAWRAGLGREGWKPPGFILGEWNPPPNSREVMDLQYPHLDFDTLIRPLRMYRTASHKLIWCAGGEMMLFDLRVDRGEQVNEAATLVTVRDELLAALAHAMESVEPLVPAEREVPIDEESLKALRALGYIGSKENAQSQ